MSVKHLILIRHAKSSWRNLNVEDHDRGLNKRGTRDVPVMAKKLADLLLIERVSLDAVLSSSAIRARLLAEQIASSCDATLNLESALYTFSSSRLSEFITRTPDTLTNIALVGHNPAMSELAEQWAPHVLNHMPTSAYLALRCDIDSWSELQTNASGRQKFDVLDFNYPKRD